MKQNDTKTDSLDIDHSTGYPYNPAHFTSHERREGRWSKLSDKCPYAKGTHQAREWERGRFEASESRRHNAKVTHEMEGAKNERE